MLLGFVSQVKWALHSLQHNTIEAVLQRGEKLDDLVAKSEELSMSSKAFYTTVRSGQGLAGRKELSCARSLSTGLRFLHYL